MCPGTEDDVIRLKRKYIRTIRKICNVGFDNKTSVVKLRDRWQLNTMRECLQNGRLLWFGKLKERNISALEHVKRSMLVLV